MYISMNWIKDYIDIPKEIDIKDLWNRFTLNTAEVDGIEYKEDDVIIEIDNKSLTHRPDLWGHYGIAREIATILRLPLKKLEIAEIEEVNEELKVNVEDKQKCNRYSGIKISNVKDVKLPENIKDRLIICGVKSISPIVDLTNYIMLEIGQPMHAFDSKIVNGDIKVQEIETESKFETLDGIERELQKGTLVIKDTDKILAVAGVMGGKQSMINEETSGIILESANFEYSSIRKTAIALGLRTDASARYEKSLDPNMTILAIKRFIKILKEYNNEIQLISNIADVYINKIDSKKIEITKSYIDSYIGEKLDVDFIVDILTRLEFKVDYKDDLFTIEIPTFRNTKDINIKADIVEEIARMYGYDNLVPEPILAEIKVVNQNKEKEIEDEIKDILAEKYNMNEVHTYIWEFNDYMKKLGLKSTGELKIINSVNSNTSVLRDTLKVSLLQIVDKNKNNFDDINIFEIGSTFELNEENLSNENKKLCIVMASKKTSEKDLYYKMKNTISYLLKNIKNISIDFSVDNKYIDYLAKNKILNIKCNGNIIGDLAVVDKKTCIKIDKNINIVVCEVNVFEINKIDYVKTSYVEPSKYPEVNIDFSFLIDKEKQFAEIKKHLNKFEDILVKDITLKDIYEDDKLQNKKSMTFRLKLISAERTLLDEEIKEVSNKFLNYMQNEGYEIR